MWKFGKILKVMRYRGVIKIDKNFKYIIILIIGFLAALLIFQSTSGLFESQSPESKILELLD